MHLRYDKLKEVNGCACRWIYERVNLRVEPFYVHEINARRFQICRALVYL